MNPFNLLNDIDRYIVTITTSSADCTDVATARKICAAIAKSAEAIMHIIGDNFQALDIPPRLADSPANFAFREWVLDQMRECDTVPELLQLCRDFEIGVTMDDQSAIGIQITPDGTLLTWVCFATDNGEYFEWDAVNEQIKLENEL